MALCAIAEPGDTLLEGQTLLSNDGNLNITIDSVALVDATGLELSEAYVFDPSAAGLVGLLIGATDTLDPAMAATLQKIGQDPSPVIPPESTRAVLVELEVRNENASYGRIRVEYRAGKNTYTLLGPTELKTATTCD